MSNSSERIKDLLLIEESIPYQMSDCVQWKLPNGRYHRKHGPAIIYPSGLVAWYLNGVLHREDGPAVSDPYGAEYWYLNGDKHRLDGPAVIESNGTKEYWQNGVQGNILRNGTFKAKEQ